MDKHKNTTSSWIDIVMIVLCISLFGLIATQLNSKGLEHFDLSIISAVQSGISPQLTSIMLLITCIWRQLKEL